MYEEEEEERQEDYDDEDDLDERVPTNDYEFIVSDNESDNEDEQEEQDSMEETNNSSTEELPFTPFANAISTILCIAILFIPSRTKFTIGPSILLQN